MKHYTIKPIIFTEVKLNKYAIDYGYQEQFIFESGEHRLEIRRFRGKWQYIFSSAEQNGNVTNADSFDECKSALELEWIENVEQFLNEITKI